MGSWLRASVPDDVDLSIMLECLHSRTHPLSPPRGLLLPFPSSAEGGQLGLTEVERHSQDSQLEGGQVFPSTQWGRGSAHLVNRRSSTCWGAPKSPVGAQECGEVGGVTAQEGRHQVGHQHLQSASPDADRKEQHV